MEWRRSILLDIDDTILKQKIKNLLFNYQISENAQLNDKYFDLIITNKADVLYSYEVYSKKLLITSSPFSIKDLNKFDDFITPDELNSLAYRVHRLVNIPTQFSQIKSGLILHRSHKYLKFKNSIIFLTNTEYVLMEYLLSKNIYLSTNDIVEIVSSHLKRNYRKESATVLMNRLKSKIFKGFGLRLIKTRYGVGYYLSI